MSDGSTIEFHSPYLSAPQKASLKLLEDGLLEGSPGKCQEGLRTFFEICYQVTAREVRRCWGEANVATLEAVARDASAESEPLRTVLWDRSAWTPFAHRFLRWLDDPTAEPGSSLTVGDLNEYLRLSVRFYASLSKSPAAQGDVSSHLGQILDPETMSDLAPLCPQATRGDFHSLLDPPATEQMALPEMLAEVIEEAASVPAPDEELEARLEALLEEPWESCEVLFPVIEELSPASEVLSHPSKPEVHLFDESEIDVGLEAQPESQLESEPRPEASTSVKKAAPPSPVLPGSNSDFAEIEGHELPQSPLSPLEERRQLVIKKKYIGYGKNEDGVLGYCGQLIVTRFDDGALKGQLESSNPLFFFSPQLLRGASVTVTYWMPPAAFPHPGGHLSVRNEEQTKVLPISSLFPRSRTDFLKSHQVVTLLLAPSVLGLLYFCFVYVLSVNGVIGQVKELFPEMYTSALRGSAALDFRSQGVGLYQLEVVPAGESLSLIWAALIWLCPLVATKFFRHLSRDRQRDLGGALGFALLLPSFGVVAMWNLQKILFPLLDHPDFGPLDLRGFLAWSVPLNLVAAVYLFLSVHGVWDRKIAAKEIRLLLPLVLSGGYLVLVFLLIFGRSWTG